MSTVIYHPHVPRRHALRTTHRFSIIMNDRRLKGIFFKLIGACLCLVCALVVSVVFLGRGARWRDDARYTVLVVYPSETENSSHLVLVSCSGLDHTVTVLPLPDTLLLDVARGYGGYKASALMALATMDHLPPTFVLRSLAVQLGIDVQDIVWVKKQKHSMTNRETIESVFFETVMFRHATTLRFSDRYALWRALADVRKDQYVVLDPVSSGMMKPVEQRKDGVLSLDPVRADPLVFQLFSQDRLRKEELAVAVVNAAQETRLGTRVARALANMGIDVTQVSTAQESADRTTVWYAEKTMRSTQTLDTIQRVLGVSSANSVLDPQKTVEYRADIVLFLGKDTAYELVGTGR